MLAQQWRPKTRAQTAALNSEAEIVLFGGSAGSLKSFTLLADAAQEFRNPNLRAVIFRESYPQLTDLIRKAYRLYPNYPYFGLYNKNDKTWDFPVNATELADPRNIERVAHGLLKPIYVAGRGGQVIFRYMSCDDDVYDHQGQEYSFIGFDESTHHSEFQIQYLLSRLRSTDPTLRLRMRLATNPGGDGHHFHMVVFLGSACPHCEPGKGKKPFAIYKDACWVDGTPLDMTTQFIPGNVTEHELFGQGNRDYIKRLKLQRPATAAALLAGCWKQFEGQYFTCWEENRGLTIDESGNVVVPTPDMRMVVPWEDLPAIEYWWPHFTGTDYGFTISRTAGYLFVRTPADEYFKNGRIYVLDEYVKPGVLAEDVAREMLRRWFLQQDGLDNWTVPERPRAIQMWALSHDAFNDTGVKGDNGVSITRADQMNQVMQPFGMGFLRANNDREGGWQHIFRLLRSGELVICKRCEKLIAAIPSRTHDPDKPDDIRKVIGDELDDCIDAFRYGVYSWFKVGGKPMDLVIAEAMKAAATPTDAMITRLKLQSEVAKKNAPIFTGGRAAQRRARYQQELQTRKNRLR